MCICRGDRSFQEPEELLRLRFQGRVRFLLVEQAGILCGTSFYKAPSQEQQAGSGRADDPQHGQAGGRQGPGLEEGTCPAEAYGRSEGDAFPCELRRRRDAAILHGRHEALEGGLASALRQVSGLPQQQPQAAPLERAHGPMARAQSLEPLQPGRHLCSLCTLPTRERLLHPQRLIQVVEPEPPADLFWTPAQAAAGIGLATAHAAPLAAPTGPERLQAASAHPTPHGPRRVWRRGCAVGRVAGTSVAAAHESKALPAMPQAQCGGHGTIDVAD
mmetsp:Transcript_74094/g.239570  ORF Transcript_74094/g.239570 Transcript_74094/m.239570 type:complete len:274 (-) Transcript_74094:664-1485(-)